MCVNKRKIFPRPLSSFVSIPYERRHSYPRYCNNYELFITKMELHKFMMKAKRFPVVDMSKFNLLVRKKIDTYWILKKIQVRMSCPREYELVVFGGFPLTLRARGEPSGTTSTWVFPDAPPSDWSSESSISLVCAGGNSNIRFKMAFSALMFNICLAIHLPCTHIFFIRFLEDILHDPNSMALLRAVYSWIPKVNVCTVIRPP